jgi:hypothetical protein
LREWINLTCHAEKLVEHHRLLSSEIPQSGTSSEDYYEIKSLLEKIGTNRRLLERKILLDFQKPFDLIPQYKSTYKNRVFSQEGAIAPSCPSKTQPSQIWSQLLNAARTYFERLIVEV